MLSGRIRVVLAIALFIGLFLLAAGALALLFIPKFINDQVLKQDFLGMDERNGTLVPNEMTRKWIHPPYDMRLHIWMYSVENEKEYLAGKEKLRLSQKGPYTFVEDQEKQYEFEANDTRIVYTNNHRYIFNQSLSCAKCHLSDKVTIPNVVFQKLVDFAEQNWAYKLAIESVLAFERRESPFLTITVGEALFQGYDDPLISAICDSSVLKFICDLGKIPKKIGFFYGQNNSIDGTYEVGTGQNGSWTLGHVYKWNKLTTLPDSYWESPYARMLNGTDGQLFAPLLQKDKELVLFASQACRSVRMAYTKDSEYEGVSAWRFSPPKSMYDPSLPENKIFCHLNDTITYFENATVQHPGCLPAGMLDLSHCQPGNPRVYLSQAHFLDSPKEVWSSIDGLDVPTEENDLTYVDIEPTSGVPVWAKRVMQVNVGMFKGKDRVLSVLKNTQNLIVPVFWVNETASFDEGTRDQLLNQLQAAKHISFIGGIAALIIGLLLIAGVILTIILDFALSDHHDEDDEPLVNEEEAERGEENAE